MWRIRLEWGCWQRMLVEVVVVTADEWAWPPVGCERLGLGLGLGLQQFCYIWYMSILIFFLMPTILLHQCD